MAHVQSRIVPISALLALVCACPAQTLPATQIAITVSDCTAQKVGTGIPIQQIGEPVSGVTLSSPVWNQPTPTAPAACSVDGEMLPVSKGPHAQPIKFRVMLPAVWRLIAIQFGGGGMNGVLPRLNGVPPGGGLTNALTDGAATYGSDSGHSVTGNTWALDDEAIQNLSYMQMKKTHDAAMVVIKRIYGAAPRYSYYAGTSQGGREALTVAQRYPADYDGITANVPIVNFSGLMIAPVLMRIRERSLAQWVPPVKGRAIAAEFMRQCDGLDGAQDGVINNYQACRAIFDQTLNGGKHPWTTKLCPNDVDPNPQDDTETACLTSAQVATLEFDFSRYRFPRPYANGVKFFGMWAPTTAVAPAPPPNFAGSPPAGGPASQPAGAAAPAAAQRPRGPTAARSFNEGGNTLVGLRYRGQEGAAMDAPLFTHMGILGAIAFVMQDLDANPLDYIEGGRYLSRRLQISQWMDATNPDLSAFRKRGGKLLITIGTDDTIASSGSQLDYFQAVLDKMGRPTVDSFMRMWVIPQANHGLEARVYPLNGKGQMIEPRILPNQYDRIAALRAWVENGVAPPKVARLTGPAGSLPLCSYPDYPRYTGGPQTEDTSYTCTAP